MGKVHQNISMTILTKIFVRRPSIKGRGIKGNEVVLAQKSLEKGKLKEAVQLAGVGAKKLIK